MTEKHSDYWKHKIAVAPMMDWTDRYCRVFHRRLTRRALLYTEMIVADAVLHGDRDRLLAIHEEEHPVAIQLGGSDPEKLGRAARIAADYGYDEINLMSAVRRAGSAPEPLAPVLCGNRYWSAIASPRWLPRFACR